MVKTSANGQIFVCQSCSKIHLEFGCFSVDFMGPKSLKIFLNYLLDIDGEKYEQINKEKIYRRKIIVPLKQAGINLHFTSGELQEVCNLIKAFLEATSSKSSVGSFNFKAQKELSYKPIMN